MIKCKHQHEKKQSLIKILGFGTILNNTKYENTFTILGGGAGWLNTTIIY